VASFDEVIPPGQAGKVSAAIRTDGLSGAVSKVVTVTTDDPGRPTFTLTLRATIVASVDFYPSRSMFLAAGLPGGPGGKVLARKSADEKGSLEITGLTASAPWLKVSARKLEAAAPAGPGLPPSMPSDWLIEAKIEGEPPPGNNPAQVKFKTGLSREPEIEIPVNVRVPPPLSFSAPVLDMPVDAEPPQSARGTIYVLLGPGLDPKGLLVESVSPGFRAKTEPVDSRRVRVDVTWSPVAGDMSREGAIVAKLGELSASISVRLTAPVLPAAPPAASTPEKIRQGTTLVPLGGGR